MKVKTIYTCLLAILYLTSQPLHAKSKHKSYRADYVIVGVGTAGAVLAKELSDDKNISVIALQVGENFSNDPDIKFSAGALNTVLSALIGPPLYENGETIAQSNADNRQLLWALALPEGGASSINAGAYCRGTNQLYAEWEAIAGAKWSIHRILKLYKKLEHYHGQTPNKSARGFCGPISVRQECHPSKVSCTFTKAIAQATNTPFVLDYNDPHTPIGVSSRLQYTQSSPDGVLRVSSATAFLNKDVMTASGHGVDGRKLRVLFNSIGLKTIWQGNKAVGVTFLNDGKTKKVFAKKGVIICAGLKSSSFLMHSGVGPKPLLDSLNIPVIFDNPNVGLGLADQPAVRMIFTSNPSDSRANPNGLFSQIAWLPAPGGDPMKREFRIATATPIPGVTGFLLDLCQPRSRGSITINSSDPLAPPVVDLGVLTDPTDLSLFQQGLQVYVKAINEAVQGIDPSYQLIFPDPAILDDLSLVTAFIKQTVASNQHFQSHCRMAPQNMGGVVDSTGHVYGVRNLIVADDSIVPLVMDGSPMATAYLIGANIARILHEETDR